MEQVEDGGRQYTEIFVLKVFKFMLSQIGLANLNPINFIKPSRCKRYSKRLKVFKLL